MHGIACRASKGPDDGPLVPEPPLGGVKAAWMEEEARGWTPPATNVCDCCVEDEYLKQLIRNEMSEAACDYCGRRSDVPIAAPVEVLMGPIAFAVYRYFAEPGEAGVPYDEGEYVVDSIGTSDVLTALDLECHESLFEDLEAAFHNQYWVPAAHGQWLSSHPHEELLDQWHRFVEIVKYRSRFFFERATVESHLVSISVNPATVLQSVAECAAGLGLIQPLADGTPLYRARMRRSGDLWEPSAKEMGAPPRGIARAGRMNPAGIPYLYVARERSTAIAEVAGAPPCALVVAEFKTLRDLTLLDLGELPELPSVFDESRAQEYSSLIFLREFADEVSHPVAKDGREHLEYAPTQVVCEFFAQAQDIEGERRIEGIIYGSAVFPEGRNIVLFPDHDDEDHPFAGIVYVDAETVDFQTWTDLSSGMST